MSRRSVISGHRFVGYIPWTESLNSTHHHCTMRTELLLSAFGKVLRELREARGLSQEALALSASVDRTFVSQIERAIRQPTLTTLWKLAKALDIQPSTLITKVERGLR